MTVVIPQMPRKQANAPLPRLLLGTPTPDQLIKAVNDIVEYLEANPRIEIMERPQGRVAYPFELAIQSQDPRAIIVNAWDQNANVTIPVTGVQWYRKDVIGANPSATTFSTKLTINEIDGIADGDVVRMTFIIFGKAAR